MNTKAPKLSIVIPGYNEADNLPIVAEETVRVLDASELAGRYELLVVNDGSSDGSREVVDALARKYPAVRAFHHARNMGLGEGLKTGYKNSVGDFVTFIPGDGEIKVDQVIGLYRSLGSADMITSTRLGYVTEQAIVKRSWHRELFTWGFRLTSRLILGFNLERLSGIYVVRGDIVRSMPLHACTALVSCEILMYCQHIGAKMAHGEITIAPRISGVSKIANFRGITHQLWDMFKMRRHFRERLRTMPAEQKTPVKKAA